MMVELANASPAFASTLSRYKPAPSITSEDSPVFEIVFP
jgi:hypothetical protein